MDRLPKKFAQPIHPFTATALPHPSSNSQWTQICDFQTRTRTRNPGLTFPKPENTGLQKEPGFGNSTRKPLDNNNNRGLVSKDCNDPQPLRNDWWRVCRSYSIREIEDDVGKSFPNYYFSADRPTERQR